MRVRIGLKPILSLVIIAAGTLASYYVNALWLNIVMAAAMAVLMVVFEFFELWAFYGVLM